MTHEIQKLLGTDAWLTLVLGAAFVAAFVMRLGVTKEAVDDVVQEVFLTAHRLGGHTTGAAKPTTWLAEIALRIVSTCDTTARTPVSYPAMLSK